MMAVGRVKSQVRALKDGDFDAFLHFVNASGMASWTLLQNVTPAGYIQKQDMAFTIALCQQLLEEGFVDAEFHASVVEREAIVSTMLGDGIALPHSLGLLAKKTVVYTVIAPQGIAWGDETAHLIFLLAISKREYEEALAIYDIFVTFLRERAMSRLAATRSFDEFKTVAMECVSRF